MSERSLGRFRVAVLLVATLVLQATVASDLRVRGAAPDFLLLLAVCAGLTGGASQGTMVGFAAGLATDLYVTGTPVGLSALTLCLVGYGVGTLRETVLPEDRLLAPLLAATATAIAVVAYLALGDLAGQSQLILAGRAALVRVGTVEALWSGVLALPGCWLYRRAARGTAGVNALDGRPEVLV